MWRCSILRAFGSFSGKKKVPRQRNDCFKSQCRQHSQLDPNTKDCKPGFCRYEGSLGGESETSEGPKERKHWQRDAKHVCSTKPCLLETLCWLGTAFALGLNLRYKLCHKTYQEDLTKENKANKCIDDTSKCPGLPVLLYRLAFTAPGTKAISNNVLPDEPHKTSLNGEDSSDKTSDTPKDTVSDKELVHKLEELVLEYSRTVDNYLGVQLMDSNPKQAIERLKDACDMGCAKACFNLGVCYETGKGTPVDFAKAAQHYHLAVKHGHSIAAYNLGVFYLEGIGGLQKNYQKGVHLINKAASAGVTKAQTAMGILYCEQEEWNKAIDMFNTASTQGDLEATYQLGLCYENGWGVPSDLEKASDLYIRAAHKGHDRALQSLGEFYEKGLGGVERNAELAAEMYQMAIDAGNEQAKANLRALQESEARRYQYIPSKVEIKRPEVESEHLPRSVSSLHSSSSSPELRNIISIHQHRATISQYLGLILPSILDANQTSQNSKSSLEDNSHSDCNGLHMVEENCGCRPIIPSVQHIQAVT